MNQNVPKASQTTQFLIKLLANDLLLLELAQNLLIFIYENLKDTNQDVIPYVQNQR